MLRLFFNIIVNFLCFFDVFKNKFQVVPYFVDVFATSN